MDQTDHIREVVDQPAVDRDGEVLGRVADVFVDEESSAPKWVALRLEGRADSLALAPIGGVDLGARPLRLAVDRAQVLDAPALSSGSNRVSPEEEAEIERHYAERSRAGAATTDIGSQTGETSTDADRLVVGGGELADDRPMSAGMDAPVEVVRSEEELVVDTRVLGRERVRLVKRIVTESVTRTVELRHEELVIERETLGDAEGASGATRGDEAAQPDADQAPVTRGERLKSQVRERLPALPSLPGGRSASASAKGAFSGETTEVILMQEEVVLTKRIVPRERVRVRKEVVVEQREISDSLRKEQVDLVDSRGREGHRSPDDLQETRGPDLNDPAEESHGR